MSFVPQSDNTVKVLSWIREAINEGESFNKAQRGYSKITDTIDAIMSDRTDMRSTSLSSTSSNHIGKLAEDCAGFLTDTRPFWEYKTWNKQFQKQAGIFSKLGTRWWQNGGIAGKGADMSFTDTIKYSLAGGSSYAHLEYDDKWGDIVLNAEDPRDVLPIRPGDFSTIQDAYGVIVRRARTVNYVRSMTAFKGKEHLIEATKDGTIQTSLSETRAGKLMEWLGSPFRNRLFANGSARDLPRIPTTDVYKVYLADESRNETKEPKEMGEWGIKGGQRQPLTNWSYLVQPGDKLYPNKRLIICTESVIGYDGPSPYWHGLFPLAKLTLVPYPWTWLGKAVLWDLLPLQRALDKMLRIVDDHMEKIARPDIKADKNSISEAMLARIDTRKAGGKFRTNPMAGKGFEVITTQALPAEVYKIIEFYISEMDSLSGVKDLSQLAKLNQMPSADTIEKAMGTMTASIRLRSRVIENFMREFAHMLMYNFCQFYTLPQRLAILGEDGVTPEDFDFDPQSLVPDFIHEADIDPLTSIPTTTAQERGPRSRYERTKEFLRNFTYNISPSSLLNSSEIEKKMMYLQLSRAGLIDHWTLLERLDIPNVGQPPAGADDITKRLVAEQNMGLGMEASAAGRKASGQAPPRMVIKES